ncbi:MAG: hypothetical protein VXY91_00855 [Bacteroidota bacterium]|nr:hypothetical protein [Bacteroidota bacterium]
MKKLLTAFAVLSFTVAIAQGTSSNLRRVSREVEKTMSITSDIIDGVMTYEKKKKITPLIEEQFNIWRKSNRSFSRLDKPEEQQLVKVATESLGEIIELTSSNLKDWLNGDARYGYGHTYVSQIEVLFAKVSKEMEMYADLYDINIRESQIVKRFSAQMELIAYTKEMKSGASEVDSLVSFVQRELGTTDLDKLYTTQKLLIKALSKHIRDYGNELFYNGQIDLYEAYQKYYIELLELTTADLLADLTKMKYDLIEFKSIATSTESSARKTLSFFDNEMRLLAKREARFVKKNLPKPPKK